MQFLTVNQIRDKFLDFFAKQGHFVLPSFPLVPQGDNSLLLINAGMTPMKPFFTGQEKPPSSRVATCQKCIRTSDIDEVGKKARYGSFFEMLGNFSFGDYFKKEVIPWAWEFLTKELAIPADRLLISVYEEDDEAHDIWHKIVGVSKEKIYRFDKSENFWEHGVGPCGPCSEIHFDRGVAFGCSDNCKLGCDCDRFMEIWNLVFIQYEKTDSGDYVPLKFTGIDTGMGLERISIVMQGADTIFDIDNIKLICNKVKELAKITEPTKEQRLSVNIIADHVRSVAFMAADGVLPSNEGRGYVLRRLLRRAVRHGRSLGLGRFVNEIAQASIDAYSHAYQSLSEKASHVLQVLDTEESRFLETLETGMSLLQRQMDELQKNNQRILPGTDAFKLYDTYGFPPDLTREILSDANIGWDEDGFQAEMQAQKDRARAARGVSTYMGADATVYNKLTPNLPSKFCGYESDTCDATVLAIVSGDEIVQEVSAGSELSVVLSHTPFYAASGGQKGDTGQLIFRKTSENSDLQVEITDCVLVAGSNTAHIGKLTQGTLRVGDTITAIIDKPRRRNIMANHSATHLLQQALRDVLGNHVEQAGSEVDTNRLRFDFTHFSALSAKERDQIETVVNERIWAAHPVTVTLTTPDEARKAGAAALFGEKYGDTVRMVQMGDASLELCGGTHVHNTQQIGIFKLISESGIASGVRRIEATTGENALKIYRENTATLTEITDIVRAQPGETVARITSLVAENRDLKKEISKMQATASGAEQGQIVETLINSAETKNGFTLIAAKLDNYGIDELRTLCDKLKAEMKSGCLLLCGINTDGAAQFLASATEDAVSAGIHAGQLVKEAAAICGGGGGGKPNHAQAGGKDASKVDTAISQGLDKMKEMIK